MCLPRNIFFRRFRRKRRNQNTYSFGERMQSFLSLLSRCFSCFSWTPVEQLHPTSSEDDIYLSRAQSSIELDSSCEIKDSEEKGTWASFVYTSEDDGISYLSNNKMDFSYVNDENDCVKDVQYNNIDSESESMYGVRRDFSDQTIVICQGKKTEEMVVIGRSISRVGNDDPVEDLKETGSMSSELNSSVYRLYQIEKDRWVGEKELPSTSQSLKVYSPMSCIKNSIYDIPGTMRNSNDKYEEKDIPHNAVRASPTIFIFPEMEEIKSSRSMCHVSDGSNIIKDFPAEDRKENSSEHNIKFHCENSASTMKSNSNTRWRESFGSNRFTEGLSRHGSSHTSRVANMGAKSDWSLGMADPSYPFQRLSTPLFEAKKSLESSPEKRRKHKRNGILKGDEKGGKKKRKVSFAFSKEDQNDIDNVLLGSSEVDDSMKVEDAEEVECVDDKIREYHLNLENRPTTADRPPSRGDHSKGGLFLIGMPLTPPEIVRNKVSGHRCPYNVYLERVKKIRKNDNSGCDEKLEQDLNISHKNRETKSSQDEKVEQEIREYYQKEREYKLAREKKQQSSWASKFKAKQKKLTSKVSPSGVRTIHVQPANSYPPDLTQETTDSIKRKDSRLNLEVQRKQECVIEDIDEEFSFEDN